MIQLKNINKIYDDGFQALKDITLTFEEGKINVLIGPSGCGKTTTMKLLNRLTEHTDGEILIDDKNIKEMNPIELRRQMGYVIQSIGLFPHMTIYDNVAAVPKLLKWDKQRINQKVDELLNMVDLDPKTYKKRYPSELSGGQQQRIGVIRALAAEPSTILMDEPFSALDPISREQLQDELVHLQKSINKTIIFVTHDMDEAIKIADQIILMKDGEVVQQGAPNDILLNPVNDFVKEFIGSDRLEQAQGLPPLRSFIDEVYPSVTVSDSVADTIEIMVQNQKDCLPVVDEKENYVGSITLYQALANQQKTVEEMVDHSIDSYEETIKTEQVLQDNRLVIPVTSNQRFIGMLDQEKLLQTLHENFENKRGGQ
ncbi:Carnitine transport ATP-binding protein OpuCA [Paraliobacillus sp. PM-2]|uniref:ABC transporter ATP-binding protein n=1 Tax=Paraliobacillus sp. PM-2 TaxID=1462524 RepID=UPI00061C320A|nr:ABC transporter ATP-binding protein [Paraliobacillus sp. PM-2]CQR47097.1 Carnitine transport ATP-binding protein OpuCA [Paraliobacillus sp. PM-2]